jgi:acetyl esterase/lipase
MTMTGRRLLAAALALSTVSGAARAQVPPDIAARLREIGPRIDLSVGQLYAPLHPKEPYAGAKVARDIAYGGDPLQKLDVFSPDPADPKPRPVLLFVHGGGFVRGDKRQTDNMVLWGVKNGMVGVDIDYRLAPKDPWPAGVKDLAAAIAWTRANISRYGGDPDRIILWGHSAGANHVADYIGHREIQGAEASSVRGAIVMSPFYADAVGQPNPYYGADPDVQTAGPAIARLTRSTVPMFVVNAELDPEGFRVFGKAFDQGLTGAGRAHPYLLLKDHDHLSEGMAVGTSDVALTAPLLTWIEALH